MATVTRIEALREARGAGGSVRTDARRDVGRAGARTDLEASLLHSRGDRLDLHRVDAGERRELGAERLKKRRGRPPLDLEEDAGVVVQNPAGERVPTGEAVDEGAKTHALDEATDADARPGGRRIVGERAHPASN